MAGLKRTRAGDKIGKGFREGSNTVDQCCPIKIQFKPEMLSMCVILKFLLVTLKE